ncbi:MAG: glycosyltransferase [Chloroflexi bacterium]|nr:glycosyltransferase [Chloroflexota bacterium]
MKVSVCMMVRNEEAILGRALASTLGLADEVVIVDTGSTDGTVQLAPDFGAIVIEGGDRRHKAQSRNQAADASTGDWTVVLDADEVIRDPQAVRAFLEGTTAQAVYIRETFMDGDRPTLSFGQMRCWRRGTFAYRFRAHEVPLPTAGWGEIAHTELVWEHRPPQVDRSWKREHMLMLLTMDVEENPGEPRPLYYLAREYMYLGAWWACIETTRKYLAVATESDHERAEAFGLLATCYRQLKQHDQAHAWLHQAMAAQPESRAWPGLLAELYHEAGEHDRAAAYLRLALTLPRTGSGYLDERWYGSHIYDLLARCLYYGGHVAEGLPFAEQALALSPNDQRLKDNLEFFRRG